jgi:Glycosyltransferase family 87
VILGVSYVLALIGCLAIGVRLFRDSDRYNRQDFNRYYADAMTLQKGGNPWQLFEVEDTAKEGVEDRQVAYPPAFYLMFSPLTRVRGEPARWIWEGLQIVALISALIIVLREVGLAANKTLIAFAFAFAFLFPPLHSALHWGQPTPLLLLLLVASWASARRGWDIMAGALLAVATLLKIFPGVVGGYFLFGRRWRVLAFSLIFAAILSMCLLVLYGVHRNLDFLRGTRVSTIWLDRRRNLSIIGSLYALLSAGAAAGKANVYLRRSLIGLACFSIVAISGKLASPGPDEPVTSGLSWSLWVISSILLSPVAWDHYLVLIIPLYVFLAAQMTVDNNSSINQANGWSYLLGLGMVLVGLLGFIFVPYFAVARRARGYLILVLMSYAGLCLVLRQIKLDGRKGVLQLAGSTKTTLPI